MKIFFIWIATIGCGIANGILYSNFGTPENLAFVFCVSFICTVVLIIHRRVTKTWKKPAGTWPTSWSEYHFPIFRVTMILAIVLLILLCFEPRFKEVEIVACSSIAITSFIAYLREHKYTDDWIKKYIG